VYLTFDDGPIPEVTPKVLEILERYHVKATFFMVGENIDKHPEVYEQVIKAGHAVGNHTYNHLKGWRTPFHAYMENTEKWEEAFRRQNTEYRVQSTDLFRPPYGKATLRQRMALHRKGYKLIYWDILTRDYDASVTPEQMLRLIQRDTRPGSIINFHDSVKSNERMLQVLPLAIEWILSQGYELGKLKIEK
jgi:peptidoglycan/xylan/chitin deacetylase (PgdA/CDA1 family)